jgi:hypothetical protein
MMNSQKIGRNDPCPCGSGKKFKKCCLDAQRLDAPSGSIEDDALDFASSAFDEAEGQMLAYDPFVEPDPEQWLALDEGERINLVMEYHRRSGIRFPRPNVHAIFHAVVESQIADPELPVRDTVERLMGEGLDRHEAIHAVGYVLAGHMNDLVRKFDASGEKPGAGEDPNVAYFEELKALTAEQWRRSG